MSFARGMFAVLSPGQGAQRPGFLAPWLELPGARERLAGWSRVAGVDLATMGSVGDAAQVRDTAVTQPLLVAAALLAADALAEPADVLAGHSVGDFATAVLAGSLTAESALALVRVRGEAMAAASADPATGMAAILGGDTDTVVDALTEFGLEVANRNAAGQVVAAGRVEALDALAADPPARARVRRLEVAGAFHTSWMAPARAALAAAAADVTARDPQVPLLGGADGGVVRNGAELLERLVALVTGSVRFDLVLRTLGELGVTGVVELVPGGTLTGLVRRELPDVEVVALRTPDDLSAARELATATRPMQFVESGPSWRLVVAPAPGTFHPVATAAPGSRLDAGGELGALRGRRAVTSVATPYAGVLLEWLVVDGDPVSAGQPLARLQPDPATADRA